MNWKHLVVAACGIFGACSIANADIKYTTEMTMEGMGDAMPKTVTLRAVKPNFERSETRQTVGTYQMNHVTIRECGKKQTIKLDPSLKIYAIVADGESGSDQVTPDGQPKPQDKKEPKTGHMVMTYKVQDLGEEMVAGFKTRHYMIDTEMTSSGCAGNGTTKLKQEIWVSDIRDANPCPADSAPANISDAMSRTDCKITVETKGDFDRFNEIYKGLILRQKTYNGDKVMMTTEVTMLSQAKFEDNSLFTVPADYKLVSDKEFQKAQSEAMMKGMMGGMKNRSLGTPF